ncbi:MAG: hypothetical protein HW421_3996 [Ignavibacteria bacterium]|nr:hypothetical protein [Ignavibacteria bacterium]
MKKILSLTVIFILISFLISNAQEAATQKKTKEPGAKQTTAKGNLSAKAIKGYVIDVVDYATGGQGRVNKEKAVDLVMKGRLLGLLSGSGKLSKIYLISNTDGSSTSKQLAELADKQIGVDGKIFQKGGILIIMADLIEAIK